MHKIKILPNKHVGIIFDPRSGSHVLREFLSSVTDSINLGELFNPGRSNDEYDIKRDEYTNSLLKGNRYFSYLGISNPNIFNLDTCEQDDNENIETLKVEAGFSNYVVFSINSFRYGNRRGNLFEKLINSNIIQCIRLKRADLLSSILSIYFARTSNIWHKRDPNQIISAPETLKIPMDYIIERLKINLEIDKDIDKYFSDIPTIYYEQFQNNLHNLRNLFDGIPKKIVSNPYTKMGINYKTHVENIDEIEDYYEQFVNDNKEYFPQYFGKLPHITIPASQGNQPRDLSQLKMAVGI